MGGLSPASAAALAAAPRPAPPSPALEVRWGTPPPLTAAPIPPPPIIFAKWRTPSPPPVPAPAWAAVLAPAATYTSYATRANERVLTDPGQALRTHIYIYSYALARQIARSARAPPQQRSAAGMYSHACAQVEMNEMLREKEKLHLQA
jgi:hypothetical protein